MVGWLVCWVVQEFMYVVVFVVQFCVQFGEFEGQCQQVLCLEFGEVCGDYFEKCFGDLLVSFQVVIGVDFQGYVDEGVVVFVVGYVLGVQVYVVVVDVVEWENVVGVEVGVDFFEQVGQVGFGFDVVGVFGDEVWYGGVFRGGWCNWCWLGCWFGWWGLLSCFGW